jgi:hypothetical protein
MKFFTFLSAALFFVVFTSHAQVSLGIRGGYVNAGLASSGKSTAPGTYSRDRWQAGAYANIPLFKNGYLQAGVNYIVKGAGLTYTSSLPDSLFKSGATKLSLQYLELPVHMVYKVPVGFGKFIFGVGPYVAYCFKGDYDISAFDGENLVQTGSQKVDFKTSPNLLGTTMNLHRWDAGLNCLAGLELNCSLTLTAQYGYGMVDVDKSPAEIKNRYWGVSLGFLFDREDW